MSSTSRALVLGAFSSTDKAFLLSSSSEKFDESVEGKLSERLKLSKFDGKLAKTRYFFDLSPNHEAIVVVGLGEKDVGYCSKEQIDLKSENIRIAINKAGSVCKDIDMHEVLIEDFSNPKVVGETSALISYEAAHWKSEPKISSSKFNLLESLCDAFVLDLSRNSKALFNEGYILGEAQILAASLAETPANLKKPTALADKVCNMMPSQVECIIRDKAWITSKGMDLFLSVNQGSVEPPVLVEYHYKGSDSDPIVLVGKGITFDSGGISLKPSSDMGKMKADMQGAACVVAAIKAVAELGLKVHIIGITPFTENLPSGSATRPGDVYISMSGKTVEIDNTDAEGRLILADALTYAHSFNPSQIIDLATLTGAVGVALGSAASAIYTNSSKILEDFKTVGAITGDRVWHMPLFKQYTDMNKSKIADLINCAKSREAGSCVAACFLQEFVNITEWAHLDIAGVMSGDKESFPYAPSGMTGRPTRTLIEYLKAQEKQ